MSDIVEKPRKRPCYICSGDCAGATPPVTFYPLKEDNEAADEIERLRAEVKQLDTAHFLHMKMIERLQDQWNRLVAVLEKIVNISDRKHDAWDEAKALLAEITIPAALKEEP